MNPISWLRSAFTITSIVLCAVLFSYAGDQKYSVELKIKYFNENDTVRYANIYVDRRQGDTLTPVKWAIVNLYLNEISKLGMLGNITTDEHGMGTVPLDSKFKYVVDSLHLMSYNFIASLQNNPDIETAFSYLPVKEAILNVFENSSNNASRQIKASLTVKDNTGAFNPASGVAIKFLLRGEKDKTDKTINTVFTDANGIALFDYSKIDEITEHENRIIVASIDDSPLVGNLKTSVVINRNTNAGSVGEKTPFFESKGALFMLLIIAASAVLIYFKKKK